MLSLERRGDDIQITEEMLRAAARNGMSEKGALESLFNGDSTIAITAEVVKAAACKLGGREALEFLFSRDPSLPITEAVAMAAAPKSDGKEA